MPEQIFCEKIVKKKKKKKKFALQELNKFSKRALVFTLPANICWS